MAAIASRTSGSSSTIRTSVVMPTQTRFPPPRRTAAGPRLTSFGRRPTEHPEGWERERYAGAPGRAVAQGQAAAVFFHDLLHDRKTQPGAAASHGHVRLGEPLGRLGQTAAVVVHLDQAPVRGLEELDHDPAWRVAARLLLHPFEYRLSRVLQQVG